MATPVCDPSDAKSEERADPADYNSLCVNVWNRWEDFFLDQQDQGRELIKQKDQKRRNPSKREESVNRPPRFSPNADPVESKERHHAKQQ